MGGKPRLRDDAIDRIIDLRTRVSHLETRGVDWYRLPGGGITTPWAVLALAAGWAHGGGSFGPGALQWRIVSDRVAFMGMVNCVAGGAGPVAVLPGDARPAGDQVIYWHSVSPVLGVRVVGSVDTDGLLLCPGAAVGQAFMIGDLSYPAIELP